MNQEQWQQVEMFVADLSIPDKMELIERIARSIRSECTADPDRARQQRSNLIRLMEELATLPLENNEQWSNRDHDRVLYGESS